MSSTQEVGEIFGSGSGPAHAMLRSPTVLIASVGLWGMNVFFFKLFRINYVQVLKYDLEMEKKKLVSDKEEQSSHHGGGRTSPPPSLPSSTVGGGGGGGGGNTTTEYAGLHHSKDYSSDDDENLFLTAEEGAALNTSSSGWFAAGGGGGGESDDYDNDREYHNHADITWSRLVGFSLSLLVLLHSTYWLWIDVIGRNQLGAVFAFYGAVTTAIVLPFPSTKWLRKATVLVLQRSFELINPRCNCVVLDATTLPRAVPFVDVFFADAMCSLSKVFFDWGMLFHMAAHYPHPVPSSAHNILIPSACAAVPFVIRARQCWIMYNLGRLTCDAKRFSHLANALKYTTSIFPLCLSAYQKTISATRAQQLEPLLIVLLVINSVYALYWDIVMDWGMLQNPTAVCYQYTNTPTSLLSIANAANSTTTASSTSATSSSASSGTAGTNSDGKVAAPGSRQHHHHPHRKSCGQLLMRNRLRFGVTMSALIVLADSILRFSWTLRFYHPLFPSGDSFVLCTQFLEVFRRALWNLLRVEWEHLKQKTGLIPPPHSSTSVASSKEKNDSILPSSVTPMMLSSSTGSVGGAGTNGVGNGSGVGSAAELTSFITKKSVKQATA